MGKRVTVKAWTIYCRDDKGIVHWYRLWPPTIKVYPFKPQRVFPCDMPIHCTITYTLPAKTKAKRSIP